MYITHNNFNCFLIAITTSLLLIYKIWIFFTVCFFVRFQFRIGSNNGFVSRSRAVTLFVLGLGQDRPKNVRSCVIAYSTPPPPPPSPVATTTHRLPPLELQSQHTNRILKLRAPQTGYNMRLSAQRIGFTQAYSAAPLT